MPKTIEIHLPHYEIPQLSLHYLKVNESIFVRIKGAENMVAKFVRISRWETFTVDLHESFRGQSSVWAITLETPIPFYNRIFIKSSRCFQKVQILLTQTIFGFFLTHFYLDKQ